MSRTGDFQVATAEIGDDSNCTFSACLRSASVTPSPTIARASCAGVDGRQPIVDAVHVDAGGEDVGVAAERQRREIAAVAMRPRRRFASGSTSARACRYRPAARMSRYSDAPRAPVLLRELKRLAVADAEPVIDRQHDEAAADEILVRAVVVGVLPAVVPAEQHLPRPAAVDVDDRRLPRLAAGRLEQLPCASTPSLARNATGSGVTSWAGGKSCRQRDRRRSPRTPPADQRTDGGNRRSLRVRREIRRRSGRRPVTTGLHSMPAPLVSGVGVAAFTGTLKR